MNLLVSLLCVLFKKWLKKMQDWRTCQEKDFDLIFTRFFFFFYHLPAGQSSERTLLFLICIQINVPLLIFSNFYFRENFISFFCFFFFCLFLNNHFRAVTWSHPVRDLQKPMRKFHRLRFCLSFTLSCWRSWGWAVGSGCIFCLACRENQSATPAAANWTQGRPANLKDGFTPRT